MRPLPGKLIEKGTLPPVPVFNYNDNYLLYFVFLLGTYTVDAVTLIFISHYIFVA